GDLIRHYHAFSHHNKGRPVFVQYLLARWTLIRFLAIVEKSPAIIPPETDDLSQYTFPFTDSHAPKTTRIAGRLHKRQKHHHKCQSVKSECLWSERMQIRRGISRAALSTRRLGQRDLAVNNPTINQNSLTGDIV
ncbi:hypothetical protein, partial [Candidatus Symbiopectobacterium sp. PLON1]|uniref:hypothetical protein n=1 Tax=Candidatus Symbiopectobacterium sp. PLON1 TaxID=2794575 RepID=UPI0025C433A3